MLYAIIEKNRKTDISEVHSVFDDKSDADWQIENLILDLGDLFEYRMISVADAA
jgi:hypothetical protein